MRDLKNDSACRMSDPELKNEDQKPKIKKDLDSESGVPNSESSFRHPILSRISDYRGLPSLDRAETAALCSELRDMITRTTLANGGHLGGSLGAVELCVSLLRVFDPASDRIIFDVGHQTYAYKILTGRADRFATLRTAGGISGFPRRSESPYDVFDTGHSSTSISAALGFAKARDLAGERREVVAVIGDGALLNGLAFEGLNNAAACGSKVTIVLNDNKMSISPRVGGMASHLARLAVSTPYTRMKRFVKDICRAIPGGGSVERVLSRVKDKLKGVLLPRNIFESMEISYWGPFDGHDVWELSRILEMSKLYDGPLLIHVITKKGKGHPEAEASPEMYHGVGAGSAKKEKKESGVRPDDWSMAFSDRAIALARQDSRVVACTAAMGGGTRIAEFARAFPGRYFDVGIAEGHMLTFAGGMAAGGMRPIVCVYSTFLQRAMDSLVHDICMMGLPVLVAVDRAGLTGEDGETHQGLLDVAWGRAVPGLVAAAPRDRADLDYMMEQWLERSVPMLIRYPKGRAPESICRVGRPAPWLRAEVLRRGHGVAFAALGDMVAPALEAADAVGGSAADIRWASPLDMAMVDELLGGHDVVITAEDGYGAGGVGEAIASRAAETGSRCRVLRAAVAPAYVPHATRGEQLRTEGLTADGLIEMARRALADGR